MEDNIYVKSPIIETLQRYQYELPDSFDVLFDSDLISPAPEEITSQLLHGRHIYQKTILVTPLGGHGASRGANFYLLTREAARRLYDAYLPILLTGLC